MTDKPVTEREVDIRFEMLDQRLNEREGSARRAVDAALKAAKEAVDAALISAKEAVGKAEAAQQRVNQTQNEFRGTLKDQASMLMPRAEHDAEMGHIQSQLEELKGKDNVRRGGEQGRGIQLGTMISVAVLIVGIASVILVATR